MPAEENKNGEEADEGLEEQQPDAQEEEKPKYTIIVKKVAIKRSVNTPSWKSKSPWLKSSKKKFRKVYYYVDEFGNQFPAEDLNKSSTQTENNTPDKQECKDKDKSKSEDECQRYANDDEVKNHTEIDREQMDTDKKDESEDHEKPTEKLTNGILDSEDEPEEDVRKTRSSFRDSITAHTRSSTNPSPRSTRSAGNSPGRATVISPSRIGSSPGGINSSARSPILSNSPRATTSGTSHCKLLVILIFKL